MRKEVKEFRVKLVPTKKYRAKLRGAEERLTGKTSHLEVLSHSIFVKAKTKKSAISKAKRGFLRRYPYRKVVKGNYRVTARQTS